MSATVFESLCFCPVDVDTETASASVNIWLCTTEPQRNRSPKTSCHAHILMSAPQNKKQGCKLKTPTVRIMGCSHQKEQTA